MAQERLDHTTSARASLGCSPEPAGAPGQVHWARNVGCRAFRAAERGVYTLRTFRKGRELAFKLPFPCLSSPFLFFGQFLK